MKSRQIIICMVHRWQTFPPEGFQYGAAMMSVLMDVIGLDPNRVNLITKEVLDTQSEGWICNRLTNATKANIDQHQYNQQFASIAYKEASVRAKITKALEGLNSRTKVTMIHDEMHIEVAKGEEDLVKQIISDITSKYYSEPGVINLSK